MFTVGFVIAERVLYLPSAGFIIIVVLGIRRLCLSLFVQKVSQFKCTMYALYIYITLITYVFVNVIFIVIQVVRICIILLVFVHSIRTYQRSEEWSSELTLFQSALNVCPMNAKVHYNLAKSLADIGRTQEAIHRYKHALL